MKAKANGREFESESWNGVVSLIAAAFRLRTKGPDRADAAYRLEDGETVTLGGMTITPL